MFFFFYHLIQVAFLTIGGNQKSHFYKKALHAFCKQWVLFALTSYSISAWFILRRCMIFDLCKKNTCTDILYILKIILTWCYFTHLLLYFICFSSLGLFWINHSFTSLNPEYKTRQSSAFFISFFTNSTARVPASSLSK